MRTLIIAAALALGTLGFASVPTVQAAYGWGHHHGYYGGYRGWGGYRHGYLGYYGRPYWRGYYGARPYYGYGLKWTPLSRQKSGDPSLHPVRPSWP